MDLQFRFTAGQRHIPEHGTSAVFPEKNKITDLLDRFLRTVTELRRLPSVRSGVPFCPDGIGPAVIRMLNIQIDTIFCAAFDIACTAPAADIDRFQ